MNSKKGKEITGGPKGPPRKKPVQHVSKDSLVGQRVKARQDLFLISYGKTGTIKSACEASGQDRATIYKWRTEDVQNFKIRFEQANELFREGLQDLALNRIREQKPDGNPVLLITMLNACWPEKYRRDAYRADDGAKELMTEWKKWKKDMEKRDKTKAEVKEEIQEIDERTNAIQEVEKMLARRRGKGTGTNGSD